ncbi:GDSL esterase/lipase At2g04570-like [Wolffia australiana]
MRIAAVGNWFLVLLVLCQGAGTAVAVVTSIIVFGDSSVDAGNNNAIPTIARSNFPPYGRDFAGGKPTGRFCNGRLATDFISQYFGLKPIVPAYLDPEFSIADFATGVTFASAATGFDNITAGVLAVIPLWRQLEYFMEYQQKLRRFKGAAVGEVTLREALYVVSLGTNDFIENYYAMPARSAHFTVEQYQDFVAGIARDFLVELYHLGARKIDLSGLSPIGCVPISRTGNVAGGGDCRDEYNRVAVGFNSRLQAIAAQLNANLPGARIVYTSVYDIILDIVNHPETYGFENARLGCCATGLYEMGYVCKPDNILTCPDASKYVFWDAVHPTEKTYSIVANYLMRTALGQFLL